MGFALKLSPSHQQSHPQERIAFLAKVALMADIKDLPGALDHVASLLEEKKFAKDEAIIREGEAGTDMYFLMKGEAGVFKSTSDGEPFPVTVLKDSMFVFFGEGALLDDDTRSATIKAQTDCICLVFTKKQFETFCVDQPQWALPFLKRVARIVMGRLRKTNADFVVLYNALVNEMRGL